MTFSIRMMILGASICASSVYSETTKVEHEVEKGVENKKVLFVYDKVDKQSSFYINAFRKVLGETGHTIEEAAVESEKNADITTFDVLVIYSRVMAFNMMSPVRKWIKERKNFSGKDLFIYVTADRWFYKGHYDGLIKLVKKSNGNLVDGVTMATNKMTDEQKIEKIGEHLIKLKQ